MKSQRADTSEIVILAYPLDGENRRRLADIGIRDRPAARRAVSALLSNEAAAAYLGFRTRAGIRNLVYRGELRPDGRGYRGGYVFSVETLDAWFRSRQELIDGR